MQCNFPVYLSSEMIFVPCGKCIGCRIARSREWTIRLTHESTLYKEKSFITLTYDDDHLPPDLALRKDDLQKFIKRLRKKLDGKKIKYFACGEYGERAGERPFNPHYHLILFGSDVGLGDDGDRLLLRYDGGRPVYTSKTLRSLWLYGHSSVGRVCRESIQYVTGYVLKKRTGDVAVGPHAVQPVFMICSQGIGYSHYVQNYLHYLGHSDHMIPWQGRLVGLPRFYRKKEGLLSDTIDVRLSQLESLEKEFGYAGRHHERLEERERVYKVRETRLDQRSRNKTGGL